MKIRTAETADRIAAPVLRYLKAKHGVVPESYAALGIDGATLLGLMAFEDTVDENPRLTQTQRLMVAVAVAAHHGGDLPRHGLTIEQFRLAREGRAKREEDQAILDLALCLLRGEPAAHHAAWLDEELVVQLCAHVAMESLKSWVLTLSQTTFRIGDKARESAAHKGL